MRWARLLIVFLTATLLVSCGFFSDLTTPSKVGIKDIDNAYTLGRHKTVCKGLQMDNPLIREHAAKKLALMEGNAPADCVCKFGVPEDGPWDVSILEGLHGSTRDDLTSCYTALLDDPNVENRGELVKGLLATGAPAAKTLLLSMLESQDEDDEIRALVFATLRACSSDDMKKNFRQRLASDPSASIRAKAAASLSCDKSDANFAALLKAAKNDKDGSVRAKAINSADSIDAKSAYDTVCNAMLNDDSAKVRKTAVELFRAPKRKGAKGKREFACLKKRALKLEPDASVREALLKELGRSPRQDAADVLCEAIPFWIQNYIDDEMPGSSTGNDIIEAQNNRYHPDTTKCVRKALGRRGRYTCIGKQYVALWAKKREISAHVPKCPTK